MSHDAPDKTEEVTISFTPPQGGPAAQPPIILPWLVLAATMILVLRSIGVLLAQVQLATGSTFGDMNSIASGASFDFVDHTKALLATWAGAAQESASAKELIAWTARAYTIADTLFIGVYVTLMVQLWRRVRFNMPPDAPKPGDSWTKVRIAAHTWSLRTLAIVIGIADVTENVLRQTMVELVINDYRIGTVFIVISWLATTAKFVLIGLFGVFLLILGYDTGLLKQWLQRLRWAAWRLRVAVVSAFAYVLLMLADATGQAVDLVRRWLDDPLGLLVGALSIIAALLMGLAVWLQARRVVLSDQSQRRSSRVAWGLWLPGTAVVVGALVVWKHWWELIAVGVVALALFGLGYLGPAYADMKDAAASKRAMDARNPQTVEDVRAARRMARFLAVTPPVTLLMLTAIGFAPVLIVLPLSGEAGSLRFISACAFVALAVAGAPLIAAGGWKLLRRWDGEYANVPDSFERKYLAGLIVTGLVTAASLYGAFTHNRAVGVCVIVATLLAATMLVLGEAQRWAETHEAPPGVLFLGLTRMPFAALTVVIVVLASFWISDGSAHAVHRQRDLPAAMTTGDPRAGITLDKAFSAWVDGNCAGFGHSGSTVPMFLIAAPGGGVRAAYWTSSSLTEIFGARRDRTLAGCPGAAPADRIFAMGGASGGSLGALAYTAGIDLPGRSDTWYDDELARPDVLTDTLAWMLTVDLARAGVGYGGDDRARRMEDAFARNVPGLGDDFFAGTWGAGGHHPVMFLTGTQVENGCRVNLSGVRLTDETARDQGAVCTGLNLGRAQADAPVTTDLLDLLCGPDPGSAPQSLSRATVALLSARFPYVSPSGQMYDCGDGRRTAVVDGGYAENSGIGELMSLWTRLEPMIAEHNSTAGKATIVPVFVEVDNHYERVAAQSEPSRTVEGLVPPMTQARPDVLDDRALEDMAASAFAGTIPGTSDVCRLDALGGRFIRINPYTSPGLPAPLAWTLSRLATDDLAAQRTAALSQESGKALTAWANGPAVCAAAAK